MVAAVFPETSGPLRLQGVVGALEAVVEWPTDVPRRDVVGILCHPHPLHGGTMSNKVVTTTGKALNTLGCTTLRFNFRGVGGSEGSYDGGIGEGDDLIAVSDFVRASRPTARLILAGFSFGAYVSLMRAAEIRPDLLISMAPAIGLRDFSGFREPDCPWLVVQPGADEVIDPTAVRAWVSARRSPPTLVWLDGASHFFHGRLLDLREAIVRFVAAHLPASA